MTTPDASRQRPQPYRLDYGDSEDHRLALACAVAATGLELEELWMMAFALGADIGPADLDAYLEGLMPLPGLERDVLAQAMNEHLADLPAPSPVPYTRHFYPPPPPTGPLAAFVTLLEGAQFCPPERLPRLAAVAAHEMGVLGATIHLVDYEQDTLTALGQAASPVGEPLPVEGSMAGRAFQTGHTVTALNDPPPRHWVPILDGDERLGVLEVLLNPDDEPDDPNLRKQCQWLAAMLGHLLGGLNDHGDSFDALRGARPRTAGAELVWALLPPLTAGVDGFVVSGLLAPTQDLGGDIFDYAVSHDSVSVAVFDAMGHGIDAGIIAAAAVSAYRAARRGGDDLHAQAAAIDQTVAALFPDAFVTGVLAELELGSGRFTYINAGHPRPLVLRGGTVISALADGGRVPLGLIALSGPDEAAPLGEVSLEPGDWLALYTDGVTEARAADGALFGEERLTDYLERAASSSQPPPETVRRLLHAVLGHQHGELQDDATLLLAQWHHPSRQPLQGDART